MAFIRALNHLRKRKIVEWTLAYLAGAWLLMQLVDVLAGRWPVPMAMQRGVDLLLLVGFFVALTFAWYHGEKGRQNIARPELIILAALLFIAGGLLSMLGTGDKADRVAESELFEPTVTPDSAPGIAVLPFRNLSGSPAQDYFVAGMHEALITSLSKIGGLRVISRTSVMRYADTSRPLPQIANELKVNSIIEGSVNMVGDQVRITVQLLDGNADAHIWADEFDRDLRDVLVQLSQVAESVAEQVEVILTPEDAALLRSARSVDPELHDLYMRGRYASRSFSLDAMSRAVEYFEQAIEKDPNYAPAWAGLSVVQVLMGYVGFIPPDQGTERAERAALRAIELDPQEADAYTALGWVRLFQFRWEEARHNLARALELNPNHPDALHGFGDYLTITGSKEDGLAFVKRSRDNDPFSVTWSHSVVHHLFMNGHFEEAIAEAEDILKAMPNSPVWFSVGTSYWKLGRPEKALDSFRFAVSRRPKLLAALESGYASGGPTGAISAVADAAADRAMERRAGAFRVAASYARAGNEEKTLAWLENAYAWGSPDLIYVGVRPEFEFLHAHPQFLDLLARMRLQAP